MCTSTAKATFSSYTLAFVSLCSFEFTYSSVSKVLLANFSQLDTGSAFITPVLEEVSAENNTIKLQVMQINKLGSVLRDIPCLICAAIALPVKC